MSKRARWFRIRFAGTEKGSLRGAPPPTERHPTRPSRSTLGFPIELHSMHCPGQRPSPLSGVLVGLLFGALFVGCSPSGSGSGGPLGPASKILTPTALSSVQPLGSLGQLDSLAPSASALGFQNTADYFQDAQATRVHDPLAQALKHINGLLAGLAQVRAAELIDVGPYAAQVDWKRGAQSSSPNAALRAQGQSASSATPDWRLWSVESTQTGASGQRDVALWMPEQAASYLNFAQLSLGPPKTPGDTLGVFNLTTALVPLDGSLGNPDAISQLRSREQSVDAGAGLDYFYDQGNVNIGQAFGGSSERIGARVELDSARQSGRARLQHTLRQDLERVDSGAITQEYLAAFDATHVLHALDGGAPEAFRRDRYTEIVQRYALYHAEGPLAGSRVDLNAGFGFRTSNGEQARIDVQGVWIPEGVRIEHGERVTREGYGSDREEATPYSVVRASGRLLRFHRHTLSLGEIEARSFELWTQREGDGTREIHLVRYEAESSAWMRFAKLDSEGLTSTPLTPPSPMDTSSSGGLVLWSDSLGGRVIYVHGEDRISFYSRRALDPNDERLASANAFELQGFTRCLRAGIQASELNRGDVFLEDAPDLLRPHNYVFQPSDLTLYLDSAGLGRLAQVGAAEGLQATRGPNLWGMQSGPLLDAQQALRLTSVWDAWNADSFWVYESGPNEWNRFFGLRDDEGHFASFEEPLEFIYRHQSAMDRNASDIADGQTFLLRHGGPSGLAGLPQTSRSGAGPGDLGLGLPEVNLRDGTRLQDTNDLNYVVKALELEQWLKPEPNYSGELSLEPARRLSLPDGRDYRLPEIGAPPRIEGAARVVAGVLQGAD